MKTILLLSAALLLTGSGANGQILLRAGSSYSYQFSTLAFQGNSTFGIAEPAGTVFLYVDPTFPENLGPTDSYKVEMFEDGQMQTPILSRVITRASSIHDTNYRVPNSWGDLQGSIRVTALSGSITLRGFSFQAFRTANPVGFDVFGTGRIFLPAPPTLSAVVSGSALVISWPASGTNFVLEAASNPILPGAWEPVTNKVNLSGGSLSVALNNVEERRFFRLRWTGP